MLRYFIYLGLVSVYTTDNVLIDFIDLLLIKLYLLQLNETVSEVRQDISKVHEKVERVTNVNESNISNVKEMILR